jgi:hypothetical protein
LSIRELAGRRGSVLFTLLVILLFFIGLSACDQPSSSEQCNATSLASDAGSCPKANFDPATSLEILLRGHSQLLADFEDLLHKAPAQGEIIAFLDSFEDLLRRMSSLLSEFESILESKWYGLDRLEQEAFLCSFEDLIERDSSLLNSFKLLINQEWVNLDSLNKTKFLFSFEDLLRRESDLLQSYEELYKKTYGGIIIKKSANMTAAHRGDIIKYTYIVENLFNDRSIEDINILDDALGQVTSGVILRPLETKIFYKNVQISGDVCNRAKLSGRTEEGQIITAESNIICVRIMREGNNYDIIKTGKQTSRSFASRQPPTANSIEIMKTQRSKDFEYNELYNIERVYTGDQDAFSAGTGGSNNSIKITLNQH